jgi:2-aminoadipate transaminase
MYKDFESYLSTTSRESKRSVIRELLKLVNNPDIISFAGGLPSPESFPVEEVKQICNEIIPEVGSKIMQYGSTEGDPVLRDELIKKANKDGMSVTEDNLLITTASQQGLDLTGKIFLDRGDAIVVGIPTYLGGLSAFKSYGADIHGVKLDDEGMSSTELDKTLKQIKDEGKNPKFVYIVPDFQNPSGVTMSKKRRIEILEIAHKHEVFVIEDSPYRELRYKGEHEPTLYSLDKGEIVILLGTFSKILIPGFRIGWVFANKDVINRLTMAKQAVDLCTSPFVQRIAAEFLKRGKLEGLIDRIKEEYSEKMNVMLEAFDTHMPNGVSWTQPDGGLFLMVTVPEHIDLEKEFQKAIEKNVAYVIGNAFTHDNSNKNTMRINFSFSSKEKIKEGVKRLGEMLKELI